MYRCVGPVGGKYCQNAGVRFHVRVVDLLAVLQPMFEPGVVGQHGEFS